MSTLWQTVTYRELKAKKAGHPTKRDQAEKMRDDQSSEEKLMKELDRMYLRVADLERGRIATRVDNPDEYEQNSDERLV